MILARERDQRALTRAAVAMKITFANGLRSLRFIPPAPARLVECCYGNQRRAAAGPILAGVEALSPQCMRHKCFSIEVHSSAAAVRVAGSCYVDGPCSVVPAEHQQPDLVSDRAVLASSIERRG